MKQITTMILCSYMILVGGGFAQNVKKQTDRHIVNQQERMVHKQWDHKKFTPTRGFLSLNYQYWITWGLHPDYPKTDRRPLGPSGPQTFRQALVLAMQHTEESYRKHADTLRNTATQQIANHSGAITDADPLWLLYYRREFTPVLEQRPSEVLANSPAEVAAYLREKGLLDWYLQESATLRERLQAARSTDMDRGSRMLAYHGLLGEYRALEGSWQSKKSRAAKYIFLSKKQAALKQERAALTDIQGGSDIQIAERILGRILK